MNDTSVDALSEIFLKVVDAPADRRHQLLQELCPDQNTRAKVLKLLEVDEAEDPLLDHALFQQPIELNLGDTVAGYTLVNEIAHGGMGIVYLAKQSQPIRRDVALKVIKPGVDTREVIARFNAERQALSLMDHPNIAKVLDAGATEAGRPFFVMEYVQGQPLTTYCQKKQMPIDQRLRLFATVCHAIQHAHQKGIIHRDIKPSNVMVAEYDDQPVAKVIDFGVAKAINQVHSRGTIATGIGQILGTFDYMSPEQTRLNHQDIDTRSDIYSLGVLLYELLTDTPPFDPERLRTAELDQLFAILREEDPPRPSARLEQLQHNAWPVAPVDSQAEAISRPTKRRAEIQHHLRASEVRGELDWIVMKAMDKDRSRRYSTPNELADDIDCFLAGHAVSACPPSPLYLFSKFAKRNRTVLATSGLIGLSVLLGILGIAYQWVRASRAEAKANTEAFQFIIENVLGADSSRASAGYSPDPNLKLMILLKNAKDRVDERFAKEPELKARMKGTLANLLNSVGQYQDASSLYDEYYDYLRVNKGYWDPDTIRAMRNSVKNKIQQSRFEDAAKLAAEALGYSREYLGDESSLTLMLLDDLATLYHKQNQHEKAVETYQDVLEIQRRTLGEFHADTLATQSSLATVYEALGNFPEAKELHVEVLQNYHATLLSHDARLAAANQHLGKWYLESGLREESQEEFGQAAHLLQQAYDVYQRSRGSDHTDTLDTAFALATTQIELRQYDRALQLLEDLVLRLETLREADDRMALEAKIMLGWTYMNQGQLAEAEHTLVDAYERLRSLDPEAHLTLQVMGNLAICRYRMGKLEDAISLDEQTALRSNEIYGPDQITTFSARARLYLAYRQLGRLREAEDLQQQLLQATTTHPDATKFLESISNSHANPSSANIGEINPTN